MKTLEIVFGNSCYNTMKNSKLNSNNILVINTLFNIGDLSNIENGVIKISKELWLNKDNDNIKEEMKIIINNIREKNKIRIWTGHNDIYSYLTMLYISSIVRKYKYELYVLYSDNYHNYISPSIMKEVELEKLSKMEYKLSKEEINNNANIWENLVRENSELRIIENSNVKSVSLDYYNEYILNTLKKMGKVKIS